MDYIRQSLSNDETLIHIAQFHWMYTVNAVFNIIFFYCSVDWHYMVCPVIPACDVWAGATRRIWVI